MELPRQPQPVKITLEGETIDIDYWITEFTRLIENRGAGITVKHRNIFTIYPRAVND